jgi:sulfur carrier protein ThiS
MLSGSGPATEERCFLELRRKVKESEILSAAVERLLQELHFTGKLSVVVQNGRVLKSGYEEGYFSHRTECGMLNQAV